jgi:hypothetical protein
MPLADASAAPVSGAAADDAASVASAVSSGGELKRLLSADRRSRRPPRCRQRIRRSEGAVSQGIDSTTSKSASQSQNMASLVAKCVVLLCRAGFNACGWAGGGQLACLRLCSPSLAALAVAAAVAASSSCHASTKPACWLPSAPAEAAPDPIGLRKAAAAAGEREGAQSTPNTVRETQCVCSRCKGRVQALPQPSQEAEQKRGRSAALAGAEPTCAGPLLRFHQLGPDLTQAQLLQGRAGSTRSSTSSSSSRSGRQPQLCTTG